jgi:cell division protein FtsL
MKKKLAKMRLNKQEFCLLGARCSFVLLIVSLAFQVVLTNEYATKGNEMVSLQEQARTLDRDVSLLKLESSGASSLAHIEQKAHELGFEEYDEQLTVISSSQFVALSDY